SRPAELRIAALECLAGRGRKVDPEAFTLLTAHLSEKTDPLLRLAAARTLGASPLSEGQLRRLASSARGVSTPVLRLLLPAFGRSSDPRAGQALAEALKRSPAAEGLAVGDLDRAFKALPPEVRELAGPLR